MIKPSVLLIGIAAVALSLGVVYANSNPVILGNVVEVQGKVTIHNEGSPRGKRITTTPTDVGLNQFVRTYSNSKARVTLADDSKVLITESSTLELSLIHI